MLLTDPAAPEIRPTRDVDMIVEALGLRDYYTLESQLRELGFTQMADDEGVLCRWTVQNYIVDIMPTDAMILGFGNRWYIEAAETAVHYMLEAGLGVRVVNAPCFLATKLEAFYSRGDSDYMASHDLEDVVTVIDGRFELPDEISGASTQMRTFIGQSLSSLLENSEFQNALPGLLPPDSASQARYPLVRERMGNIIAQCREQENK